MINKINVVDSMIKWENGDMEEDETVDFFQYLVDSGTIYSLQGVYGRAAAAMQAAGLIHGFGE